MVPVDFSLINGRRRRTRTVKVRTALSRPLLAGQTDNEQLFLKSGQNPDNRQTPETVFRKIRTKARQGQDTYSAVRRRSDFKLITVMASLVLD